MDDVMGGGSSFSQLEHADDALEAYASAADSLPDLTYKVRVCEGLVECASLEVGRGLLSGCSFILRATWPWTQFYPLVHCSFFSAFRVELLFELPVYFIFCRFSFLRPSPSFFLWFFFPFFLLLPPPLSRSLKRSTATRWKVSWWMPPRTRAWS